MRACRLIPERYSQSLPAAFSLGHKPDMLPALTAALLFVLSLGILSTAMPPFPFYRTPETRFALKVAS